MERAKHGRGAGRKPAAIRPGVGQLKIVPQSELHPPRRTGRKNLPEERAEIRIAARNTPVRMIERVEALRAKADGVPFMHTELALESEVEEVVAGSRDGVAARIAESEGRRCAERIAVEEAVGGALAARQRDALSKHAVRPVLRAGVGEVQREIEGVDGGSVLQQDGAAQGPVLEDGTGPAQARKPVHIARGDAPPDVGKREPAFQ